MAVDKGYTDNGKLEFGPSLPGRKGWNLDLGVTLPPELLSYLKVIQ